MLFILRKKLFSFSRYLNFCIDFLVMKKKRLDSKYKVNFKIYDVTTWLTNNYNTFCPISCEVKTTRQEIWSINRKQQDKYFSSKIMQKIRQGD